MNTKQRWAKAYKDTAEAYRTMDHRAVTYDCSKCKISGIHGAFYVTPTCEYCTESSFEGTGYPCSNRLTFAAHSDGLTPRESKRRVEYNNQVAEFIESLQRFSMKTVREEAVKIDKIVGKMKNAELAHIKLEPYA